MEFEVIGNVFETPELVKSKIEGARTTRKQPSKGVARGRPKLRKPTGLPSDEYKTTYDAAFHPH